MLQTVVQCDPVIIRGVTVFVFSLQEQLRHLYPRIKVLSFGAKPESTLHTYLPSFLSRATPHCPDDMKKEVRAEHGTETCDLSLSLLHPAESPVGSPHLHVFINCCLMSLSRSCSTA